MHIVGTYLIYQKKFNFQVLFTPRCMCDERQLVERKRESNIVARVLETLTTTTHK